MTKYIYNLSFDKENLEKIKKLMIQSKSLDSETSATICKSNNDNPTIRNQFTGNKTSVEIVENCLKDEEIIGTYHTHKDNVLLSPKDLMNFENAQYTAYRNKKNQPIDCIGNHKGDMRCYQKRNFEDKDAFIATSVLKTEAKSKKKNVSKDKFEKEMVRIANFYIKKLETKDFKIF